MSNITNSTETNIQVVVRIRPRSSKEIKENSPVWIASPNGLSGKELSVKMGGSSHANEKTYTFDKVFGPDTDQTLIYDEVAENMVNECLLGYNCSILAYGIINLSISRAT
jgi:kinesin family protein 11